MEENNSQILENAHAEFKRENFKMAEELYTKFISSWLQSRYRHFILETLKASCCRL